MSHLLAESDRKYFSFPFPILDRSCIINFSICRISCNSRPIRLIFLLVPLLPGMGIVLSVIDVCEIGAEGAWEIVISLDGSGTFDT